MTKRQLFAATIFLIGLFAVAAAVFLLVTRPSAGEKAVADAPVTAAASAALPAQPTPTTGIAAIASPPLAITTTATDVPTVLPEPIVEVFAPAFTTHIVSAGETIYAIGRRYGISPTMIVEANNLLNPDALLVGQELVIPAGTSPEGEAPTPSPVPPSPTPAPTPTPPAPEPPPEAPPTVNGIARALVAFMPEEVLANSRQIFSQGQQLGRNPRAFSKLGDSVIAPPFLEPYDVGNYDLGIYNYLEGVIQYFSGSFARDSASQRIGLHSWTVFDPMWADKDRCAANEGSLPCEVRLHNPAFLIIRLGSNDVGVGDLYESQMRRIVEYSLENSIVPILGTKADRNEGSNYYNQVVRRLAAEYQVPLWDYDLVAETVPGRGLDSDGIHLDGNGHFMQNVSALVMLDRLWREVIYEGGE